MVGAHSLVQKSNSLMHEGDVRMEENHKREGFLRDFLGAFGDTGIFIPLALGMIIICGLSPTSVFLPAGILYVLSGLYYKVPMPVQPLKAVAAIALAGGIRPELIPASAYVMAFLMLTFLLFDLSRYVDRIFSKPVVRGIQVGLGVLLVRSGFKLIFNGEVMGVALPEVELSVFSLGSDGLSLFVPSLGEVATAFVVLVIPQIPLTLGNSMVGTADLAKDYFGERARRVNLRSLATTIGLGNLFAGVLSGMPLCHGCGGLTAHYRFGARTGRANLVIGCSFLLIALLFAQGSSYFLRGIPLPLFGASLALVGVFHALLARDMRRKEDVAIVVAMGLATVVSQNLAVALFVGLAFRGAPQLRPYFEKLHTLRGFIFGKGVSPGIRMYSRYGEETKRVERPQRLRDRHNRTVTYLRISVTEECNLRCVYCVPKLGSRGCSKWSLLTNDEIFRLARVAVHLGIEKIRLTGGEPLLREGIKELVERISSIDNLKELCLSTNGIFLEKCAGSLKGAGVNRINVSLDTLNEDKFKAITGRDDLKSVIRGLKKAQEAGLSPIKLNVVVLRGINDDELEDFIKFGREHDLTVRFIEYMPIGFDDKWKQHFMSREEIVERLSSLIDPKVYPHARPGEPSKYFHLTTGGEAGVISPVSHGFCQECNRLRVTADGSLRSCLTQDTEVDVKPALRGNASDTTISELFEEAVMLKPERGAYAFGRETTRRNMSQIGG